MPATSPAAIARKRQRDRQRKKHPEVQTKNRERSRTYQQNLGPAGRAANNLRAMHGMTPAQKQQMLDAQEGRCYLCGEPLAYDKAVIDHDHSCCSDVTRTGRHRTTSCGYCRRGLACGQCNTLIGMAGDDAERLVRIARNLAAATAATRARIAGKPQQLTLDALDAA